MPGRPSESQKIIVHGAFNGFERKLKVTLVKVRSGKVRISVELGEDIQVRISTTVAPTSGQLKSEAVRVQRDAHRQSDRRAARRVDLDRWEDDGGSGSVTPAKNGVLKFTFAGENESITASGSKGAGCRSNGTPGIRRVEW